MRHDDGSLTLFTTIVLGMLMLFAAVSLDLGAALDAKVRALHAASEAARMGAQQLDLPALHTGQVRVLNPDQAKAAAQRFLTSTGATGTVTATTNSVTVYATARQHTWILPIVGIDSIAMTADATASPETATSVP
ncbi:TadE/TadG family type IV pilus assembly protein [Catenulispora pinisilvae]|uniref:TadE/TadG family type IV pilus assembly protein n=1 Tax=Catenulispora pinisilvae TaxID=2705253 RepID=UPI001891601A|nr:pilus assembly protein TadG-related protein [Catenulispora pinisilvae]